jgi:phospholipid transport system substrate-binding protein
MHVRTFYRMILVAMFVFGIVDHLSADDQQPITVLQEGVDQGLALLSDGAFRNADGGRTEQEARIGELTTALFDFAAMSRMVLSSHWKHFTATQQTAFVQAFTSFLQRTYVPLLLDRYNGEQLEYVRQARLSPSRARVEVKVLHRGKAIPVNVKMIHRQGRWRVYDVDVLGFSAVANYRAQFEWLLARQTPDQVIERLRRGGAGLP